MNDFKRIMDKRAGKGGCTCPCCGYGKRNKKTHRILRKMARTALKRELGQFD